MCNNEKICFKCLRSGPLELFKIPELGAGSFFNGFSTELHLCPDCLDNMKREWLKLEVLKSEKAAKYQYEDALLEWINDFSIEGRERFYNTYAFGWRVRYQSTDDWINESQKPNMGNCRKEDQMKNCEESYLIVYPDGRKRLDCPFNSNLSCQQCPRYIARTHAPQEIEWNRVREHCVSRYDAVRRVQENQNFENKEALEYIASGEYR